MNEYPAIYSELLAGQHKSVRAASVAAGLVKAPGKLNLLKNSWKKATAIEQRDFIRWIRSSTPTATTKAVRPVVNSDGHLLTWSKKRIHAIMTGRSLDHTGTMREMGMNPRDTSLWSALRGGNRPTRIGGPLVVALEKWLQANRSV